MPSSFRVVVTPLSKRDIRSLTRRDAQLLKKLNDAFAGLEIDPYNYSKEYPIKKLTNVKDGQWRFRIGDFRLRYDIIGSEVVLHSFRNRREAYE
jgi:mRNA-degrading endonuclease RelE of RelBE toxin-antitoxin system